MNRLVYSLLLSILALLPTTAIKAQMFSVKTKEFNQENKKPIIEINLGVQPTHFYYFGDRSLINQSAFAFNNSVYFASIKFTSVQLSLETGGKLGTQKDLEYLRYALDFLDEFSIYRNQYYQFHIPIKLSTESMSIATQKNLVQLANHYEITGFTLGSGVINSLNFLENQTIELTAITQFGYSSRGLGDYYGTQYGWETKLNYITNRLFDTFHLSANVGYLFKEINLGGSIYDYRMRSIKVGLGVLF